MKMPLPLEVMQANLVTMKIRGLLIMILLICQSLVSAALLDAAEVTRLVSRQEGNLEVVEYDLVGELGETEAEVMVVLETGGRQYSADRLALAGDFGKPVKVGRGKRFVWNVATDFPAGFEGDVVWDITARSLASLVSLPQSTKSTSAGVAAVGAVRTTAHTNTLDFFVDDVISLLPSDMAALISPEKGVLLREAMQQPYRQQSWSRTLITPAHFSSELAAPLALNEPQLWAGRLGGSLRHILDVVFGNPKDPLNEQLQKNVRLFIEQAPSKTHQINYGGYAGRQTNEVLRDLYSLKGRSSGDLYPALVIVTADLWSSVWKAQGGSSFAPAVSFVRKPMNLGFREGIMTINSHENPCQHIDPKSPYYRDCMTSYSDRLRQENKQKQLENYLKMQEQKPKYPVKRP